MNYLQNDSMVKTTITTLGIGPQYIRDNPFTARMRFHQSWYRAKVLKVPWGVGPKSSNTTQYGNMLTSVDGERGLNFLSPHIFEVTKRRLAINKGTIDRFRLLNNMLSSQPMCFNLFGPLVDDFELAAHLFQKLLPDEINSISSVKLEYAPEPVKDYLNDRTAFDAYISYKDTVGQTGFIGIETKLTEAFSTKVYGSPFYNRWFDNPKSPWLPTAHSELQKIQVNQLWRDHLLAVAMLLLPDSTYSSGRFMLIYHPLDIECLEALEVYKALLKPETNSFMAMPLDRLIKLWKGEVTSSASRQWITDFSLRYFELEASEDEFKNLTEK
jgi:hypothetical protein